MDGYMDGCMEEWMGKMKAILIIPLFSILVIKDDTMKFEFHLRTYEPVD